MVGGIVIEVVTLEDKVFVDCRERTSKTTCAIYVEKNSDSESIEVGDKLWWQGGYAMWTPADESRVEVKIPRLGYSGAKLKDRPSGGILK